MVNLYDGLPSVFDPNHVHFPIKAGSSEDPDKVTPGGTDSMAHKLRDVTQKNPVEASHVAVPQLHPLVLVKAPNCFAHVPASTNKEMEDKIRMKMDSFMV